MASRSRLHATVALAHWYVGQAGLKIRNVHHDDALAGVVPPEQAT